MPYPPTTTLFPYTTLFRSLRGLGAAASRAAHAARHPADQDRERRQRRGLHSRHRDVLALPDADALHAAGACRADRKSTRLNSSHEWISYAVFCLKKKKKDK